MSYAICSPIVVTCHFCLCQLTYGTATTNSPTRKKDKPAHQAASNRINTMAAKKDLSFLTNSTSSRLEATALERSKREAELQEMRRIRAEAACNGTGVNWDNGAAPITDLEEWRNAQKNAAEEERRKKMEAAEGLHGYRGRRCMASRRRREIPRFLSGGRGRDGTMSQVVRGIKITTRISKRRVMARLD